MMLTELSGRRRDPADRRLAGGDHPQRPRRPQQHPGRRDAEFAQGLKAAPLRPSSAQRLSRRRLTWGRLQTFGVGQRPLEAGFGLGADRSAATMRWRRSTTKVVGRPVSPGVADRAFPVADTGERPAVMEMKNVSERARSGCGCPDRVRPSAAAGEALERGGLVRAGPAPTGPEHDQHRLAARGGEQDAGERGGGSREPFARESGGDLPATPVRPASPKTASKATAARTSAATATRRADLLDTPAPIAPVGPHAPSHRKQNRGYSEEPHAAGRRRRNGNSCNYNAFANKSVRFPAVRAESLVPRGHGSGDPMRFDRGGESPHLWRSVDVYASPTANPVGARNVDERTAANVGIHP